MRIDREWYGDGMNRFIQLEFRNCSFDYIMDGAFDHPAFHDMLSLVFRSNVHAIDLRPGLFNGLRLASIEFTQSPIRTMEYDFLWPLRNTLSIVIFKSSVKNVQTFMRLVGGLSLPTLMDLIVANSTAVNVLRYNSLFGVKNVSSIDLSWCGLESIEERTFDHISPSLITLILDNNRLTTLPNTIYDELMKTKSITSVVMEHNLWRCDCHLSLLLGKLQSSQGFHMSVHSQFPNHCNEYAKNRANRCSRVSSVAIAPISKSCVDFYGTNFLNIDHPRVMVHAQPREDLLVFDVEKTDSEKPIRYMAIHMSMTVHGQSLNVQLGEEIQRVNCMMQQQASLNMTIVRSNAINIVCILNDLNRTTVWPLNCHTINLGFPNDLRDGWLLVENVPVWCVVLTIIYLVGIAMGMAGGFYIVKQAPKLLKGHNRVVITKDRRRGNMGNRGYTVFVMPQGWVNPRSKQMMF